ncbi:MAG: TPM domain-containing protein, partial [Eggerthellaceae bacterium]|nr:TPM domain-containing protein [Eggerthellaceae bacterium]
WSGAAETFFGDVETTLKGGKPNSTSDVKYNGTFVTDAYGLFSDSQRATLEAKATELAQKYNMGVYLLVVDKMNGLDNPTQAQRTNFATSFYRANNLGLGSGRDGIMFVIAVDSRDYVTIAFGQGSYSFSDEGVAYMEDAVREELGSNQWYDGCEVYYDKIGEQLEYYSVKGEPWTEPNPLSFILKILAILGIPAGVAFSSVRRQEDAMFTAREKTEASNYLVRGSLELTQSTDQFSHTTHVVTPIPQHEDHDSGGGSSFGGGG